MSSYDQRLLDATPQATRAQLQEGYNVDLLEPPPPRRASVRGSLPPPPPPPPPHPLIEATTSREKLASAPVFTPAKSRTSFWRTRNGVIAVLVLVLLVIGAVVGGAVGGTVKKKSNNTVHTTATAGVPTLISVVATSSQSTAPAEATFVPLTTSTTQAGVAAIPTTGSDGQNTGNGGHLRR